MAVLTARENYPDRFHPGHSPFVRFVLALAVGIGIGIAVVPDRALWAIVGAALLVVLVALISIRCTTRLRQHRYYSLLGFFVLMAWGLVG